MRSTRRILLVVALGVLARAGTATVCAAGATDDGALRSRLARMWEYRHDAARREEVRAFFLELLRDESFAAKHRILAAQRLASIAPTNERRRELGELLAEQLPRDPNARIAAAELRVHWLHYRDDRAAIHRVLTDLAEDFPDAPRVRAWALYRRAANLRRNREDDQAYELVERALACRPTDPEVLAGSHLLRVHLARGEGARAAKLESGEKLLSDRLWPHLRGHESVGVLARYADALASAGRQDEAIRALAAALERQWDRDEDRQKGLMILGDQHLKAGDPDRALTAYERVFTDMPHERKGWKDAQIRIVRALAAKDANLALPAARVALDLAPNERELRGVIYLVADLFREIDTHLGRANRFILFQKHGPAGADGREGTEDDLVDPLAETPYPAYPRRRKAFEAHHATLPDDAQAARYFAYAMLASGQPAEALRHYLDAFRKSDLRALQDVARELVFCGVRSARGYAAGLEACFEYLQHGPAGPDGREGTDDDLPDPFADLQAVGDAPQAGAGGAIPLSTPDRQAIAELEVHLERLAVRPEHKALRRDALQALHRIHQTLDDWGAEGQAEWYLALLSDHALTEEESKRAVFDALAAGKGRSLHLGGVWRVRGRIEQVDAPDGSPLSAAKQSARWPMERLRSSLDRGGRPDLKSITLSPVDVRLDQIKPLRER
jgi:tetratricopeptide (TPR) repeat protein